MSSPSGRLAEPLERLLRDSPHVWRGETTARVEVRPSGYAALDARLPGGGWPIGALIEIAPTCDGLGEISLALPALRSWCREGRNVAFVHPPYTPYAPALARHGLALDSVLWIAADRDEDARWAAEQLLREGAAAVLLWSANQEDRALRRLQLAAEGGRACAFLYRSPSMLSSASPAAVRIALSAAGEEVRADIVKVRGGHPQALTFSLRPPTQ
ncbi:MAG: translesion DNA synthesis-associated protein ImuA [Steroidobacteraceae bacterium]